MPVARQPLIVFPVTTCPGPETRMPPMPPANRLPVTVLVWPWRITTFAVGEHDFIPRLRSAAGGYDLCDRRGCQRFGPSHGGDGER